MDVDAALFVPLLLGTASVVAFLGSRNASISDRMRALNRERRANTISHAEWDAQTNLFRSRYRKSNWALLLSQLAFVLFIVMMCLDQAHNDKYAEFALITGTALMVVVTVLTFTETIQSEETLLADIESARNAKDK